MSGIFLAFLICIAVILFTFSVMGVLNMLGYNVLGGFARTAIHDWDETVLGINVEMEHLYISPIRGRLEIDGLKVDNPPAPPGQVFTSEYAVKAGRVRFDLDWWQKLMGELEKSLAAPAAAPHRIVELVQTLKSPTVEAPRELPQSLVGRLQEVAALHGGEVNLHGRLFAQWMHHAFPSECPYPHEAGQSDPISPDAWMNQDIEESEEERKKHIDADTCGPEQAAAEWTVELPWSETEELLSAVAASRLQQQQAAPLAGSWATSVMELLLLAGALGACLLYVLAPEKERHEALAFARYHSKPLSLGAIMVFAFVFDLVSRPLIVFIVGTGLVLRRLTTTCGVSVKSLEKEKCMV